MYNKVQKQIRAFEGIFFEHLGVLKVLKVYKFIYETRCIRAILQTPLSLTDQFID